jgi:hypothetical protein
MKKLNWILLVLIATLAQAGVHSQTSTPFTLITGSFPSTSSAIAESFVLNTFDIATSALGQDISPNFLLDTQGEGLAPPPQASVSGFVMGTYGVPVSGAVVTALRTGRTALSQYNGAYTLQNLLPGSTGLQATFMGVSDQTELTIQAGQNHRVDFSLPYVFTVQFTVLRGSGTHLPIVGADVEVTVSPTVLSATTDGNGRAQFQLAPGSYACRVTKSGMEPWNGSVTVNGNRDLMVHLSPVQVPQRVHVFAVRGFDRFCRDYVDDGQAGWSALHDALASRYREQWDNGTLSFHTVWINPSGPLSANAAKLGEKIDSTVTSNGARIVLVGHSMGGLICRKYLASNSTGRVQQVDRLFTIDTPHQGAALAAVGRPIQRFVDFIPYVNWSCPALDALDAISGNSLNRSMRDGELLHQVQYVFLGSRRCWNEPFYTLCFPHDGVVGIETQLGIDCRYGFNSFCFDDEGYNIRRHVFNPTDWIGFFQPHMDNIANPDMIQLIVNNILVPVADIPDGPPLLEDMSSPSVRIGTLVASLAPGAETSLPVDVPISASLAWTMLGSTAPVWRLIDPAGREMNDDESVASADGMLLSDESGQWLMAQFRSPVAGSWWLHLTNSGTDSLHWVAEVFADAQLRLDVLAGDAVADPVLGSRLEVAVYATAGIQMDSLVASTPEGMVWHLFDDGQAGDQAEGDGIFSTRLTGLPTGCHALRIQASAQGTQGRFHVLEYLERCGFAEAPFELLTADLVPVDADSNGVYEQLEARLTLLVREPCWMDASGRVTAGDGSQVAVATCFDSLAAGPAELRLEFNGSHIQNAGRPGPYLLAQLQLAANGLTGWNLESTYQNVALSQALQADDFAGPMPPVRELSARREENRIELNWRPYGAPDLDHYLVYYAADNEEPLQGQGLQEGPSPVAVFGANSTQLTGADSARSYAFVVKAVDTAGNLSEPSSPYTVFPLEAPQAIDDLHLVYMGTALLLQWSEVPGGAQYRIQSSPSLNGPWTTVTTTYQASTLLPMPLDDVQRFYRVVAVR